MTTNDPLLRLLQDVSRDVEVPADLVERVRRGGRRRLHRRRRALLVSAALVPALAVAGTTIVVRGAQHGRPSSVALPQTTTTASAEPAERVQSSESTRVFTTGRVGYFQPGAPLDRTPAQLIISKTVTDDLEQATAVLAVLPLADVAPSCVRRVTLDLDVRAVTGVPASLGVYPGAATSLAENGTPRSGEDDAAFLLDIQPRGLVTVRGSGPTSIDITDLYRLWAAGRPFPSGHQVPAGTPLVLVLRPSGGEVGTWTVLLASSPDISYVSDPACS